MIVVTRIVEGVHLREVLWQENSDDKHNVTGVIGQDFLGTEYLFFPDQGERYAARELRELADLLDKENNV